MTSASAGGGGIGDGVSEGREHELVCIIRVARRSEGGRLFV